MADGTPFIMTYNKDCTSADPDRPFKDIPDCVAAIYDINGASKPNRFGGVNNGGSFDIRGINGARLGCLVKINGVCISSTATTPTAITQEECDKYQSVLGLQYCNQVVRSGVSRSDHYAGAVLSCYNQGGRLPSQNELLNIAKKLYDSNNIALSSSTDNLSEWDAPIKTSIGIDNSIILWSNQEHSNLNAANRVFASNSTSWGSNGRNISSIGYICVGE